MILVGWFVEQENGSRLGGGLPPEFESPGESLTDSYLYGPLDVAILDIRELLACEDKLSSSFYGAYLAPGYRPCVLCEVA